MTREAVKYSICPECKGNIVKGRITKYISGTLVYDVCDTCEGEGKLGFCKHGLNVKEPCTFCDVKEEDGNGVTC